MNYDAFFSDFYEIWTFGRLMSDIERSSFINKFFCRFGSDIIKLDKGIMTEIIFKEYEIRFNTNTISGFSLGGSQEKILEMIVFIIDNTPESCRFGVGDDPHNPSFLGKELVYPKKGTNKEDLMKLLKIDERFGAKTG